MVIDTQKNYISMKMIKSILVHRGIEDMFFELKNKGEDVLSRQHFNLEYMFRKRFFEMIMDKINLTTRLGLTTGIIYLKAILKRIEYSKAIFVADIEQGVEVYVPPDLSQDNLPCSFRYYDPVLAIILENIDESVKERFNIKAQVAFLIHRDNDLRQQVLERLGLIENGKEKKLTFKHTSVMKM